MKPKEKRITLREWIDRWGPAEVAKLTKVNAATVRHWRRGHCLPRYEQMQIIHRYSKGAVSYAEMIETFQKQKALRARAEKRAER